MKKLKVLLLMSICSMALTACGKSDSTDVASSPEVSESTAPDTAQHPEGGERGNGQRGNGGGRGMQGGNGGGKVENSEEIQAIIDANSGKFTQKTFQDSETGTSLEYSLFIPKDYDDSNDYPLLMYIPDSTGAGKSAKDIVEQYYGADVWVTDEEQAKHASFVMIPAFTETVVDDNWNVSDQVETAVKLIELLQKEYSIDADRLYTTGQSMGCMTSLYLNGKYPDLFAASMSVSGQWDISVLNPLEKQKFFYITAEGDEKASGGQEELKALFDQDGIKYSYAAWNAQDSAEEQDAAVEKLLKENRSANMIRFEKGSVLTDGETGMEHMASFNYAYQLGRVRDWLFEQSK